MSSVIEMADPVEDNFEIDPTDILNFDPGNMRMRDNTLPERPSSDLQTDVVSKGEQCASFCEKTVEGCKEVKETYDIATKLLRQYSMSLVKLMESKVGSANKPTLLDVRVIVTYHGLEKLRKFGQSANSDFHALHETLNSLMQYAKPAPVETGLSRFYWLEDKLGLSLPMMAYMTVLVVACLLLVVMISKLRVTTQLIWRCLFVVFIISVVLTMVEMYQGKVAEQEEMLRKNVKEHCPRAEDMSVWERIYSYATSSVSFEDDDCKKFMKALLVNPLVTVSPIEAVAVAVVKTVVTPMDLIGQGIKNFLVGLLKGLPIQLQTFVLICLFFLMILLPLLMLGYSFNFFHLINIIPPQVVKEVQYVRSDSHPSASLTEQQPEMLYPGPASQSDMLRKTFQAKPSSKSRASFGISQVLASNDAAADGVGNDLTSSQSSIQALPASRNMVGENSLSTSSKPDGGDSNSEMMATNKYEGLAISSGLSHPYGDSENIESNSTDLFLKLGRVTISEADSSCDEKQKVNCELSLNEQLPGNKKMNPSAQRIKDFVSTDMAAEIQKLKLEEDKNSQDNLETKGVKKLLETECKGVTEKSFTNVTK